MDQFPQPEQKKSIMTWLSESVTLKLVFIGFLILVLLIPSSLVNNLITERQLRQGEIIQDVSNKWSSQQLIRGPVLAIPYKKHVKFGNQPLKDTIDNLYVLPDNLHIKAVLKTENLHRGIYNVAVYNSTVRLWGNFSPADLANVGLSPDQLIIEKAKLFFDISDLKGLKTNPVINIAGHTVQAEPTFDSRTVFTNGLQANLGLPANSSMSILFDFTLDLKGSQAMSFLSLGKTTDVEASGNWASPSFDGRYLPDNRHINKDGFTAKWRTLYYNRPYPQQWTDSDTLLNNEKKQNDATFGVSLKVPVDEYQKNTRASKYSLLIILLTFISLFLTEVIRKQKIHVFNYLLIGAAMIVYYSLLLSLSEQIGFNLSYLIASIATIGLIVTFISSILKNRQAAALFGSILATFYTFIYVIIQLEDYALMVGSIALFVIIGMLMYFSRKINWERN